MKLLAKLLSLVGALGGACYLGQKAIARAYDKTLHRYVTLEDREDASASQQPPASS